MRIGGRSGARPALAAGAPRVRERLRRRIARATRTPAVGIVVISPLIFAGAVGAAAPHEAVQPVRDTPVTPLAAVTPPADDPSGPRVVAAPRAPSALHVAASTTPAPRPAAVVRAPGVLGIPSMALAAYRNAEQKMAAADPACGVSWNLLAGIGRIESMHANGGATDARGTAVRPIYGPALDGTLPGNETIIQSTVNGHVTYARAIGPMQFLPGTWSRYAADGDGDGVADPQNLYDSALAAAKYLCSGGLDLRDPSQVRTAILRYNNSMPYTSNVLGWAAAYATGVVPVNLPPLVGPAPPLGDLHLEESPKGLGPGLPLNVNGLPADDPLVQAPLIDFGPSRPADQMPNFPWLPASSRASQCTLICIGENAPPPFPGAPPPFPGAPPPFPAPPAPGAPPPPPIPGAPPPPPVPGAPAGMPPQAPPPPVPGAPAPPPVPGAPAPPPDAAPPPVPGAAG